MSLVGEIVSGVIETLWMETIGAVYRRFGLAAAVLCVVAPIAVIAGGIAILFWT